MTMVSNPGAGQVHEGEGWTNSYEVAFAMAHRWLRNMRADGLDDIEMTEPSQCDADGRWTFIFTHLVTGVAVGFSTHGVDNLAAYEAAHIFSPRLYWNGSSTAQPELMDWSEEGFVPVSTFRPAR